MRIAIIGSGVSGSVAARLLASEHEVTLYEANDYLGGHANTVDVEIDGERHAVDTGFMVFNQRTYPNFCRLLDLLGVESQASDMSFSVHCDQTGLEYQGSSLNGLFAQRSNLLRPAFYRMLLDIGRFNRLGRAAVEADAIETHRTVGEFLELGRFGEEFIDRYLVPMAAAIWSCDPCSIRDFPARFMLGFFANHGLMQLRDRPRWRTIVGGSRQYLRALLEPIRESVRLSSPIASVARFGGHVEVNTFAGECDTFDQVVFATHADQTLDLLADATADEQRVLRCFPYQSNRAVLHTDTSLLPDRRRAWASWNYRLAGEGHRGASVTYDLSRLQKIPSAKPLLLTLNANKEINPKSILRTFDYHHPAYSLDSIEAQRQHGTISGHHRSHFCGAYWGYGFHEDGVNSALAVARHFGIGLEACTAASMKESSATVAMSR